MKQHTTAANDRYYWWRGSQLPSLLGCSTVYVLTLPLHTFVILNVRKWQSTSGSNHQLLPRCHQETLGIAEFLQRDIFNTQLTYLCRLLDVSCHHEGLKRITLKGFARWEPLIDHGLVHQQTRHLSVLRLPLILMFFEHCSLL